jgi:hypothetical protein
MCMFCTSLFLLLPFLFWSLCFLFFFDLRILITTLLSSNSSILTFEFHLYHIETVKKNVFPHTQTFFFYHSETADTCDFLFSNMIILPLSLVVQYICDFLFSNMIILPLSLVVQYICDFLVLITSNFTNITVN